MGVQLEKEFEKQKEDEQKQKTKDQAAAEKEAKNLKFKNASEMHNKKQEQLELLAKELLSEKKVFDPLSNLSDMAKKEIERVSLTGVGVCSKCRFSSGCLKCDLNKCKEYWYRFERECWLKNVLLEKQELEKKSSSS